MPATAFDWNQIQDIAIQFGTFNTKGNAHEHEDLNKSFSHNLEYADGLFITDDDANGPKTLALDPVTMLRESIVTAIIDILPPKDRTEVNQRHISTLFADATLWYVTPNQSVRRLQNKNAMDKAGEQAISNGQNTILIEIRATHWGFKPDWNAIHFGEIYDTNIYSFPEATQDRYGKSNICDATMVADETANASRARFANLLQRKYIKPKAVPPNTAILTVPLKPVESENHTAIHVPSSCVTSSLATTDLPTNKMIDSDVVATPSTTTTSVPPVTANLGPLQPIGPIADTPSVKAPCYTWTWTYSPHSELVSFHRVRSDSFLRTTSSSPPVQRQEKSFIVTAPSVSPSALTKFGHHQVPPSVPANFGWTFNPQNEIATFRRLPKSVPAPQPPLFIRLLPAEDTDLPNAAPAYIRSLQSPCGNQICFQPYHQPVLRLSKRHWDALKIKMYHLHANVLSINWFYDTVD
eukprot:jgi/Psemu1/38947/gm1.38947_g